MKIKKSQKSIRKVAALIGKQKIGGANSQRIIGGNNPWVNETGGG